MLAGFKAWEWLCCSASLRSVIEIERVEQHGMSSGCVHGKSMAVARGLVRGPWERPSMAG